ncbi:hypothetical protein GCM10018952_34480 [Streptosporangium vulgare]
MRAIEKASSNASTYASTSGEPASQRKFTGNFIHRANNSAERGNGRSFTRRRGPYGGGDLG